MHVSGCKFENGSGYVEGNGGENNGIVVKFKTKVDVEGCGVYPLSISNNCFGSLV